MTEESQTGGHRVMGAITQLRQYYRRVYSRHFPLFLALGGIYLEVDYATAPVPWWLRTFAYALIAACIISWAEHNYRTEEVAG